MGLILCYLTMNLAIFGLLALVSVGNGCFYPIKMKRSVRTEKQQDFLCQLESKLFLTCDEDGSLGLTQTELKHCAWVQEALPNADFDNILDVLDTNKDATVTIGEFTEVLVEYVEKIFNACDADGDGLTISQVKMCKIQYGIPVPDFLLHIIFLEFDLNQNLKVVLKEILQRIYHCL